MSRRIAIVGSRSFSQLAKVLEYISQLPADTIIVSGGASGVDLAAERFAKAMGFKTDIYPADWDTHGKAAGPIRNKLIVDNCDEVVAFWDARSRGTRSTIDLAKEANKPVRVIFEDE